MLRERIGSRLDLVSVLTCAVPYFALWDELNVPRSLLLSEAGLPDCLSCLSWPDSLTGRWRLVTFIGWNPFRRRGLPLYLRVIPDVSRLNHGWHHVSWVS